MDITRNTPLASLPELLKADEAAQWLGVSKGLVYEAVKSGELQGRKLGRLLFVPRDGLAAWVAGDTGGRNGDGHKKRRG